MVFAIGLAQTATDHLGVQDLRLGRPRQNDASNVSVEPGGQNAHVAENLDLASLEPRNDGIPIIDLGEGVHVRCRHSRGQKLLFHVFCMASVHTECHCRPISGPLEPCLDDVSYQGSSIHHGGQLVELIIACDSLHARQVWVGRGEDLEIRQSLLIDQVGCGRANDQIVPTSLLAHTLRPWGRGQANDKS